MKQYNIRKDLPSIKVDKALIEQLENYILIDVPSIIGSDKQLVIDRYSIEIVDSLGTGVFSRISEFPLSMFQDGTEKIKFGYSISTNGYFSLQISFSKHQYNSIIDITVNGSNPSELARGIYNEILNRIKQNRTNNYIYHSNFKYGISILASSGVGSIIGFFISKYYSFWSMCLLVILSIIGFLGIRGDYYKPYCEFLTPKQLKYNKRFNIIIVVIILPVILSVIAGLIIKYYFP